MARVDCLTKEINQKSDGRKVSAAWGTEWNNINEDLEASALQAERSQRLIDSCCGCMSSGRNDEETKLCAKKLERSFAL